MTTFALKQRRRARSVNRAVAAGAFDAVRQQFLAGLMAFLAEPDVTDEEKLAEIEASRSAINQIAYLAGVVDAG